MVHINWYSEPYKSAKTITGSETKAVELINSLGGSVKNPKHYKNRKEI